MQYQLNKKLEFFIKKSLDQKMAETVRDTMCTVFLAFMIVYRTFFQIQTAI